MRKLLAILLPVALVVAAIAGTGQQGFGEAPETYRVNVQFDNATGIVHGVDVKVAGARVGKVAKMGITDSQLAVLTLEVNDGYGPFHEDAECSVRLQSLIGEKFVECSVGSPDAKPIPNNGTLPVSNTHSPVDLDLVNNVLRKPYDQRFRIILNEFGTGLAARGEDLNVVIRRAAPALEQTNRVLKTLANQNKILRQLVEDAEVDMGELSKRRRNVTGFFRNSERVAEATALRRTELAETFRELPPMLRELRPTMRQLGTFAEEMTPVQRNLSRSAADLARTVKGLGDFSEASEPGFRTLGKVSRVGRRAVTGAKPLVKDLKPFARDLVPMGVDLAEFLEASNSREYAVEENSAAPDPKGYTALEGIFNYIFYQQTAINGFDELSYFLRVTLVQSGCSGYTDKPKVGPGDECRAHLGEPFVTEEGEFEGQAADRGPTRRKSAGAKKPAGGNGEAAPETGSQKQGAPVKVPKNIIPGGLGKLLDGIGKDVGGKLPGGSPVPSAPGAQRDDAMLDYLLGR